MRIANPIYDAVFKFFMEDPEVAKRLISNIIGQEVVSLAAQPQEVLTQSKVYPISVLGLDYNALQAEVHAEQYIDHVLDQKDKRIEQQQQALVEKDQVLFEQQQALAQAEQQKIATAKNLIALGLSVAAVAQAMQASEAEVGEWLK
jgi:hypothetical protein